MDPNAPAPPAWAQFIPLVIVVIIVAVRMVRPQRISIARMWIQPFVLCGVAGIAIYTSASLNPAPPLWIAGGLVLGALAGLPFGILRGAHTDVRPTDRPGVMYLGTSWITTVIFLGAFGLRAGIRAILPYHGPLASVVGDGLLAFALSFIVASYVLIYRKYQAELAGRISAPPAPPV